MLREVLGNFLDAVHALSGQEKTFECNFWVVLSRTMVLKFHVGESQRSDVKKLKNIFLCSETSVHCIEKKNCEKILKNNDKHFK